MKRHASMNRVYRVIWSQAINTWIAIAEIAKGRGKASSNKLVTKSSMTTRLTVRVPGRGVAAKPYNTTNKIATNLQPHNLSPQLLTAWHIPTRIWLQPSQGTQSYLTIQVMNVGVKLPDNIVGLNGGGNQ